MRTMESYYSNNQISYVTVVPLFGLSQLNLIASHTIAIPLVILLFKKKEKKKKRNRKEDIAHPWTQMSVYSNSRIPPFLLSLPSFNYTLSLLNHLRYSYF